MGLPGRHHPVAAAYNWVGIESKGYPQITTIQDEFIPVVVVGAGPTGLAVANLLGKAGIATLVIERSTGVSDIPKAIALDDEGLRVCQAMGRSLALRNCILSDLSVECVSGGWLLAKVIPQRRSNGYPLISTFYQPEFEAVLLDGLRRFPCVEIRFQHTVESLMQDQDGVIVATRTPTGTIQQVRCAYLLACDGGRSTVRHSLNIPLQGMTFEQRWLVIDALSGETPKSRCVTIFCHPQRPAVSIPGPNHRRRWELMLLPGETTHAMLEPTAISAALQQVGASPPTQIVRQAIYTFHAAQAKTFSLGRVFLLGDAAHMMPPFGGQGLNSGLRDAHNLAWKLTMVLQDRATASFLETYHQERSRQVARMVAFASILGTIFMSTARPLAYGRNLLIRLLYTLPLTRTYLMEMRIKPQAKYKAGFFVFRRRKHGMVGTLLPQPEVITRQGQRVLLDEVLGDGFTLLRRHRDPEEAFARVKTDFWEHLGARFICIQTDGVPPKSSTTKHSHHEDACCQQNDPRNSQPLPPVAVRSTDPDFLSRC
ncbi:MAG TPA: FAD-dependent monooxygenase, partial [Ktedonobacteraceae bacterium]|nr:FAD-dependent monooxygenase [Ktedonobacteraceae bacterium]